MRFAGTISISDSAFEGILEGTARSFKQHGIRSVVLLGDHGSYQKNMERIAARLNREWAADPACRVKALTSYYDVTQTAFLASLKQRGYGDAELGTHAGLADTALAMAVDKALVRNDVLSSGTSFKVSDGVHGDPRRATAELGRIGTHQIIDSSVAAIQAFVRDRI
jgi:creatinine amidohydrolase/Fe(II)-dependent formamide hydrolase-like protein